MQELINFLKEFNLQTILTVIVVMWYFTRDIKVSIDSLDRDVREMNSRICRLEGTVYGRDVYRQVEEKK